MKTQVDLNPYGLGDFTEYMAADYTNSTSCIKHQVYEQRDVHDQYGGFPETYKFENTIINQVWWDIDTENFNKMGEALGIDIQSVSTIMQPPGCVIPIHKDEFFMMWKKTPDRCRNEVIVRANMFLEDWKLGHFLQHDDDICQPWKSGEGNMWTQNHLHLSANGGLEPKYTMQISGFSTIWTKNNEEVIEFQKTSDHNK